MGVKQMASITTGTKVAELAGIANERLQGKIHVPKAM